MKFTFAFLVTLAMMTAHPAFSVTYPDYCHGCIADNDGPCELSECCCSKNGCYYKAISPTIYYGLCREAPSPVCGDGKVGFGEQCDGTNLDSETCTTVGDFTGGTLKCNPNTCQFDVSQCERVCTGFFLWCMFAYLVEMFTFGLIKLY